MNRSDDLFPPPGGTPDPYWQRAFDEVSDAPPPRVWEGVERQLDLDESDGILPLWQHRQGRQSMLFGRWAAGIAASLLLTALGWWAWHRENAIRPDVSVAVASKPQEKVVPGTFVPANPALASVQAMRGNTLQPQLPATPAVTYQRGRTQVTRTWPSDRPGVLVPAEIAPGTSIPGTFRNTAAVAVADKNAEQTGRVQQTGKQLYDPASDQVDLINGTLVFTETTIRLKTDQSFQSGLAGNQPVTMSRSVVTHSMTMQSFRSIDGSSRFGQVPPSTLYPNSLAAIPGLGRSGTSFTNESSERVAVAGAPLASSPLAVRSQNGGDKEAVAEPAATTQKKRRERPWVSAGMMASSFNPTVALRTAFSPVANSSQAFMTNGSTAGAVTLQNQPGHAVAFQAAIGIPLSEHWSIESGIGYLSGRNEIQSPSRISSLATTVRSAAADNLYADLLTRLVNQPAATANVSADKLYDYTLANQASNYTANQQQVVSNAYQFVQVPVQVGYELRPRRKFGLALLTGLVSNWFVRNTVAESITVKPGDGVYRPVTLAGTAGMRLRYRPDNVWSASVAGTFQQSLQSLTRTDVSLQALPQQVGLSVSVDRHF